MSSTILKVCKNCNMKFIYQLGTLPKEELHEMMDKKPEHTELVITGHQYGMSIDDLIERADYVTKFVKEKHPFDLGMPCRTGIEE